MTDLLAECSSLLQREALCLDTRRWDDWLALYTEDCEFWVPAWKGEHQITQNPKSELSLIYYAGRAGLADRVWRVRDGRSVTSAVLPRTHHAITNVALAPEGDTGGDSPLAAGAVAVDSYWTVHQFLVKESEVEVFFGRYRHVLVRREGELFIQSKLTILLNDYLPGKIDFYSL